MCSPCIRGLETKAVEASYVNTTTQDRNGPYSDTLVGYTHRCFIFFVCLKNTY